MNVSNHFFCVFSLLCGVLLTSCASFNRVSGDAFMKQASQINRLNSAHHTTYVGASKYNAYLEVWRAGVLDKKGSTSLIWTPIEELPADVAEKINAGQNPWENHP